MLSSLPALVLVLLMAPLVFAQDSRAVPENNTSPPAALPASSAHDEIADLQSDLQRMRTALYQMKTNLAFVGNTTTPLYHEFELNIEMWQVVIDQMQRRVDRLEKIRGKESSSDNK